MSLAILAYYLTLMLPQYAYPILTGPYASRTLCHAAEDWAHILHLDTFGCEFMATPQFAYLFNAGDHPLWLIKSK
jgi:hypothetical protein